MNAKSQIHEKMADNIRTHMEAMNAWIYRSKLQNRWVKIATVHFQKLIRVIFEPVIFEVSIDCMNLWPKNSEEDSSES